MTFANPPVLLALLILPFLAGLKVWGDMRSRKAASRLASPRLLPGLLINRGRSRGWLVLALELGALACFIVALARPQYGVLEEETGSGGRSLIVAIDTSRSMLADDLKPNRMVRTQLAAADLVKRLRGDRIGLMPFAGSAFMFAPITPDLDALLESIDSLDTEIIPRGGSNLARPIDLALETFAKAEATGQQVLILFSDGENLEGTTMEAAARARDKKMTIITIGVGTQNGALIPDPTAPGGFYRDREGKPVVSRLQRDVLMSIANTTGGLYLPLDGTGVNDRRIDLILQKLERTSMKGKITRKAVDRYRWPLGAGLIMLTGAWIAGMVRRQRQPSGLASPAVAAVTVVGLMGLISADFANAAATSAASTETPATAEKELPMGNPWAFYRDGNYDAALHNFKNRLAPDGQEAPRTGGDPVLEFGRGAAAFKQQDFDTAVDAFGSAVLADDLSLRAQSHYNLGNAIYQRAAALAKQAKPKTLAKLSFIDGLIRQLENGLENYQQALILKPGDPDFQSNHDTTDELIQKLRDLREQMAQQQGAGKGKEKKKGKKGEGESEGQGQGDGEGSPGGKGPNGEEEGGDEGDEEGEDGAGGEGEEEKEARQKSNEDKEGEIGEQGNKPSGESGDQEPGEPDEASEAENEINPETGFSAAEAKRQLELLSDEDMKVRPRINQAPERRPLRDW